MLIKILKYINSLPIKLTMKHYQNFGDSSKSLKNGALDSIESWELLRKEHPHFSIGVTREEWLSVSEGSLKKDGQDSLFIDRAKVVSDLIREKSINALFSVGAGGAGLEYQIKKNVPGVKVFISDYSDQTVKTLRDVFWECDDCIVFDIMNGDWSDVQRKYLANGNGAVIIYRVDASFSDSEWEKIFSSMHTAGVENIIYIPTGLLSVLSIWNRKKREVVWSINRKPISFAGYLRTKSTFQSFWKGKYREEFIDFAGLKGFFLSRK